MTSTSTSPRGGAPRNLMTQRRRPLLPALAAITALITVPAMLGTGSAADEFTGVRMTANGLVSPDGATPTIMVQDNGLGSQTFLATIEGLDLVIPAHDVMMIGYHEASYQDALPLRPRGILADNQNTTKFTPATDDLAGADYTILASRGRPQGAATAVDIALAPGVNVLSPVDGVVTDVRFYALYGQYSDVRVEIQPDAAPLLRVVMIYLSGVDIKAGDRVEAGRTKVADEANLFPFSSQIDRYTEPQRFAHVHIEVKPPGGVVSD